MARLNASIVGIVVIGILVMFNVYYWTTSLRSLPESVCWSFLFYKSFPFSWDYIGSSKSGYYHLEFVIGSTEWRRVKKFFPKYLEGKNFNIESLTAVVHLHNLECTMVLKQPTIFSGEH